MTSPGGEDHVRAGSMLAPYRKKAVPGAGPPSYRLSPPPPSLPFRPQLHLA